MEQASAPKTGRAAIVAVVGAALAALIFALLGPSGGHIALVVKVDPAGATVRLLEPKARSGTASEVVATQGEARFDGLPLGASARVTVSAPGFMQEVLTVSLPKVGTEHVARVKLKRESGLYTVRSEPDGALLYVDGKAAGVAPAVLTDLVPGTHELSAHLEGYEKTTLQFVVEPGGHKEVRVVLKALEGYDAGPAAVVDEGDVPAGYARVVLTSTHKARFFLNNYVLGYATNLSRDVKPGNHRIAARAEGRGTKWEMIDLAEGEVKEVAFSFDEDPTEKAFQAQDPSKPLYWTIRGGTIRNEGKYGDAVDHFKKALELDPNDIESHRQLSRTYPAMKDWDGAIKHAERYLELSPAAPDAAFTRELIGKFKELKAAQE